ncbi:MAG: hypothetical protein NPIRA02_35800 [Nitrospirales bacterium]|nr:MAG: hypothetical protein NPIRA02_35800 [Nitrospirales bacterium]
MNRTKIKERLKGMSSEQLFKILILIFGVATIGLCVVGVLYFLNFQGQLSSEHERWGTFGDFIGGTLNPILSFLALIALLLTIVLQNRELEATRQELSESRQTAQKQVAHLINEAKKNDIYKTIQVLENRLEKLYREPIYFLSNGDLIDHELYFLFLHASDTALEQIIRPEVEPQDYFKKELIKTKTVLTQLNLVLVKLSTQISELVKYDQNNTIQLFYEPILYNLTTKLKLIGYLSDTDEEWLKLEKEFRQNRNNM